MSLHPSPIIPRSFFWVFNRVRSRQIVYLFSRGWSRHFPWSSCSSFLLHAYFPLTASCVFFFQSSWMASTASLRCFFGAARCVFFFFSRVCRSLVSVESGQSFLARHEVLARFRSAVFSPSFFRHGGPTFFFFSAISSLSRAFRVFFQFFFHFSACSLPDERPELLPIPRLPGFFFGGVVPRLGSYEQGGRSHKCFAF